jgi:hypothetical protein
MILREHDLDLLCAIESHWRAYHRPPSVSRLSRFLGQDSVPTLRRIRAAGLLAQGGRPRVAPQALVDLYVREKVSHAA